MHASSNRPEPADAAHMTQELLRRLTAQSTFAGHSLQFDHLSFDRDSLQRMAHVLTDDTALMQHAVLVASERIHRLEGELARARAMCCEDELTRCLNRRGLQQAFERECARAQRSGQPLSAALIDIDNFKTVNDRFGHDVGDQALTHLTRLTQDALRASDMVGRWGGEEFVLILPDTGLTAASQVLARLQESLRRHPLQVQGQALALTFSGGLTACAPGEGCESMLRRADDALYAAKRAGKNRVMVH
jgi:diguanylate cyclase